MSDQPLVNTSNFTHTSVLEDAVIESLNLLPRDLLKQGTILDATLGGGGHCSRILESMPNLKAIGLDQDPLARVYSKKRLEKFGERVQIVDTNFADFRPKEKFIFILADLGVSSAQLDIEERGFSFRNNGPIDMRMDQRSGKMACEIIEELSEKELADLIYTYGEEKFSRRIARRIKNDLFTNGPYNGTKNLASAISSCFPKKVRGSRIHPATRTFQALRIAVNNELDALKTFLKSSPDWLMSDGLLNIISFHSLEDRLVKLAILEDSRLDRITKKPIRAKEEEVLKNPKSRSAKYRIAKKV